ncbi:MAG: hypothetical protein QOE49_3857 [Rhodospirillaceae bacterium]|jgi:hypothetical protein|nr:hypothetical protein [Rhodospirillaceae bacterium]MEA2810148.1 hypothetical protein [Rhodospirillaceae bacterium]
MRRIALGLMALSLLVMAQACFARGGLINDARVAGRCLLRGKKRKTYPSYRQPARSSEPLGMPYEYTGVS